MGVEICEFLVKALGDMQAEKDLMEMFSDTSPKNLAKKPKKEAKKEEGGNA